MPRRNRVLATLLALVVVAGVAAAAGVLLAQRANNGSGNPGTGTTPGATVAPGASNGSGELAYDAAHLDLVVIKPSPIDPDGAMGANRGGQYHTVGEQRHVDPHVIHGLVTEDTTELGAAVTAIEYAFQHQNPDGSFQVVQFANSSVTLQTYDPVGVDFFMSDLGHCLVLFHESNWFQTSPQAAALLQRVNALRPKIALSLQWLSQSAQVAEIEKDATNDTNRLAIASAAYLLVGSWLGDPAGMQVGATMAHEVTSRLTPDGVIPENGGYDSSYQSVSLLHLYWIDLHVLAQEPALTTPVEQAISKGIARQLQNVMSTGQISTTGNTRVYCGGETFRGKAKGGDYKDLVIVLTYESAQASNPTELQSAQSIAAFYAHNPGGPAAC